jgi:hypothetical protein
VNVRRPLESSADYLSKINARPRGPVSKKDGKPNTTMKGSYEIVSATGSLAGTKGAGTYTGYFTAEDKFQVNWDGISSGGPSTN